MGEGCVLEELNMVRCGWGEGKEIALTDWGGGKPTLLCSIKKKNGKSRRRAQRDYFYFK